MKHHFYASELVVLTTRSSAIAETANKNGLASHIEDPNRLMSLDIFRGK